jgi:hypothetical protein
MRNCSRDAYLFGQKKTGNDEVLNQEKDSDQPGNHSEIGDSTGEVVLTKTNTHLKA